MDRHRRLSLSCMNVNEAARIMIAAGAALAALGLFLPHLAKLDFFGKLPGDVRIGGENFSFYFPLATCLIVSAALTLVFGFFGKK